VKIAVARDAAFNFYYEENFELLKAYGAELVEFSPLKGETVPQDADGLYIGGGFPEEFAETLAQQIDVKNSVRAAIQKGIPTLAECGGFMFLTDAIVTTDDTCHEMVGLIPGQVRMQTKLAALGYREVTGKPGNFLFKGDIRAKGHEFHYSTFHSEKEFSPAYDTKGMRGMKEEGYMNNNLIAGYTHFHFGSSTEMVENWVEQCKAVKKERRDAV
jgi:cobyrinic acid a,c-diamide synthase